MKPPARTHATPPGTADTISVAELIARCCGTPEPVVRPVDPALADAVSVSALQRREGRGPHVADRRLQPRGHSRSTGRRTRRGIRSATAAASALVVAGALFAGGVLDIPVRDRTAVDRALGPALPTGSSPNGLDAEGYELAFAAVQQLFADGLRPGEGRPLPPFTATRPPVSGSAPTHTGTPQPANTGATPVEPGGPASSASPPPDTEISSSRRPG